MGEVTAITGKGTLPKEMAEHLLALVEEGSVKAVAIVYVDDSGKLQRGFSMMANERAVWMADYLLQKARDL